MNPNELRLTTILDFSEKIRLFITIVCDWYLKYIKLDLLEAHPYGGFEFIVKPNKFLIIKFKLINISIHAER